MIEELPQEDYYVVADGAPPEKLFDRRFFIFIVALAFTVAVLSVLIFVCGTYLAVVTDETSEMEQCLDNASRLLRGMCPGFSVTCRDSDLTIMAD
eukprot:m51a1_g6485 hypothetical protein (95) ;mRNA; f:134646-135120